MSRIGALQIAMTAAALSFGGSAHAQQVGTASAVNPAATANMKTISIGQSIAHKERVQTKANGSVQLLFLDKTSMTIGPNSDLTIDEYVYDPSANTGKLAATLSKGALRFVGGQISHNGDAEIKTASALIGIRGGVMMTDGKGGIYSGYGTSTVHSGGQTVTLGAGEFTQTHMGDAPTQPGLPPPGFVQHQITIFQSTGGQTGGAGAGTASQQNVTAAEHRATGSPGGSVTGSGNPPAPPLPIVGLINTIASAFTQSIQTSSQSAALAQSQSTAPAQNQPTNNNNGPPAGGNTPPPVVQRPSITLVGYAGGLDILAYPNSVQVDTFKGDAEIKLDAANNGAAATLTGYIGTTPNVFHFGSTGSSGPPNSGYTDYNNFAAVSANGSTTHGVPYNGWIITLNNDATRQVGVAAGVPNLTVCQCDYTRWGLWSVTNTGSNLPFTEAAVGTWVAGRPVQVSDIPLTGTATYTGHVIANIYGGQSSSVIAAGNFSNAVNFGTRSGAVTVTGLDHTNYSGNVSFANDPRNFGGTIAGNVGNRSMALQGSFFQGARSPVGEMGGTVGLSGTNYTGSGIFAAVKQ